jgi:hypothetical protein
LNDTGVFDESYNISVAEMDFGAIVGVVQVRGCIHKDPRYRISDPLVLEAWPWLHNHEHAEGPVCWILEDAFRFTTPIPYRGQQGLFDVQAGIVAAGLSERWNRGDSGPPSGRRSCCESF